MSSPSTMTSTCSSKKATMPATAVRGRVGRAYDQAMSGCSVSPIRTDHQSPVVPL